jgi:hypothetical protein
MVVVGLDLHSLVSSPLSEKHTQNFKVSSPTPDTIVRHNSFEMYDQAQASVRTREWSLQLEECVYSRSTYLSG